MASLPESTRRAVLRAVKEKALSKASRLLLHSEQCLGLEAEAALRLLHPAAGPPTVPSQPPVELVDFDVDDVRRALKSFPPGSGAGPSGLMAAHITLGTGAAEQRLLSSLARLSSSFAFGKLPFELRDLFCAARLIALPKKLRGVCPLAVEETLRRLAAKLLVMKFQSESTRDLAPFK